MLTAVETAPLASGPPVVNSGASTASTGVPAGSGPTATGSTRPVAMGLNVASPSYVIRFRVSQCPPMLKRSVACQIAPKFTAKPLPLASSAASAKSVPVATPSVPNVVPGGGGAGNSAASVGGIGTVERSAR